MVDIMTDKTMTLIEALQELKHVATLASPAAWNRILTEIDNDRQLAAAVYQAAGAYGMPVRFLDALSDAAMGVIQRRQKTDTLLPCDPPAVQNDARYDLLLKEMYDLYDIWAASADITDTLSPGSATIQAVRMCMKQFKSFLPPKPDNKDALTNKAE